MTWSRYAALGDSLTAGRDDIGPDGARIGWARRLAGLLTERTAVPCELTSLARDGASVAAVADQQLPLVEALRPDLVSVTVGMNDVREPGFDPAEFAAVLALLLDGLAVTGATVLTCTLPDIAAALAGGGGPGGGGAGAHPAPRDSAANPDAIPLPAGLVDLARGRLRQASDIIRVQAASRGAICLDIWALPEAADTALFAADRIHPNGRGHKLIAAAFADLLLAGPAPGQS
jgi:lysophospholipase L1-like esterase